MSKLGTKTDGVLVFSDYKKLHNRLVYCLFVAILCIAALISVFPPLWLFLSSFKSGVELYAVPFRLFPEKMDLQKVVDVWETLSFGRYYLNSLWVVTGAVFSAVLFNGLLAYGVAVLRPAGHKVVTALIMASLMIPPILNMGPLFHNIVRLNLIDSYLPLWLVFGANPFYFLIFKSYFDRLPKSLFEAAQLDGCTNVQLFTRITIPLSLPITMVVAIFTMNAAWSDFLLPFLVLRSDGKQTVMVKIYSLQSALGMLQGFGPDKLLMVLALSIIPPIALFLLFQKEITSSVMTTGLKE